MMKQYLQYAEAKEYMERYEPNVRTFRDYAAFCKSDRFPKGKLPTSPNTVYPEWVSWEVFLGCKYFTYDEAVQHLRTEAKHVRTSEAYRAYQKQEARLPATPKIKYAASWQGWGAFLGVPGFMSYAEAKAYMQQHAAWVKDYYSYSAFTHHPDFPKGRLPTNAMQHYRSKKSWVSWDDFLSR